MGTQIVPPAIQGAKTGRWDALTTSLTRLGLQLPLMGAGYTSGYNAIGNVNIPTFTTRGTTTLTKINTNVIIPVKTTMNKLNPSNLWIRWNAVERTDIISPRVEAGGSRFPTSPNVKTTLGYFEKGYNPETGLIETVHARAYPMKGNEISSTPPSRSTDVFGMYVSSKGEGSPYFLRIGSEVPDYAYAPAEFSFLPKRPTFRLMNVEKVERAPYDVRYSIGEFKEWQLRTSPSSKVTITPAHELGKMEIEGVIPPAATFKSVFKPVGLVQRIKGYGEYTTYMGKSIPVYKYQVLSGEGGSSRLTVDFFNKMSRDTEGYFNNKS
jgi:hypothetical protein